MLSGGLTIHNLRDFSSFSETQAQPIYKEFDKAVLDAASVSDVRHFPVLFDHVGCYSHVITLQNAERKTALLNLVKHKGFRHAHPRADHFVPIYVAAGAGGDGDAKIVSAVYGSTTIAFGL